MNELPSKEASRVATKVDTWLKDRSVNSPDIRPPRIVTGKIDDTPLMGAAPNLPETPTPPRKDLPSAPSTTVGVADRTMEPTPPVADTAQPCDEEFTTLDAKLTAAGINKHLSNSDESVAHRLVMKLLAKLRSGFDFFVPGRVQPRYQEPEE